MQKFIVVFDTISLHTATSFQIFNPFACIACLYFQGGEGKSLKLRCTSLKEAEDWKEALETESAEPVDSSPATEESSDTEVFLPLIFLNP